MAKDLSPSTHPLTPPLTEEVWLDWLRLLRSRRVGVSTFFRLLKEHGTAGAALDALPKIAAAGGGQKLRSCHLFRGKGRVGCGDTGRCEANRIRLWFVSFASGRDLGPAANSLGDRRRRTIFQTDNRDCGRAQCLIAWNPDVAAAGDRAGRGRVRGGLGPGTRR